MPKPVPVNKTPDKGLKLDKKAKTPKTAEKLKTPKSGKIEKTPKTKIKDGGDKSAKKEKKPQEIHSEDKENLPKEEEGTLVKVDRKQIESCLTAVTKLHESYKQEKQKQDLLQDEEEKMFVQVNGMKVAKCTDSHMIRVPLPHEYLLPESDVLLIVKDNEKGIRVDHEETALQYKSLLSDAGVEGVEVMPLRELKVEYKEYEAKIQLSNRIDKVLVDKRVARLVGTFLGKPFYRKKKLPFPVNVSAKNLKEEIAKCIKTTMLPINNHGSCTMMNIGHTGLKSEQLADNVETVVKTLESRYPGGWKNIRSVKLVIGNTTLPLYISLKSNKDVGFVATQNAKRVRETVEDELSTIPGAKVIVTPKGAIKVKRVADPDWDATNIEGKTSKPEDSKEDKEEDQTDAKSPAKKKKADKKKSGKDSDESEDEMEDKELEYMRKVAEEEEEMERREEENRAKLEADQKNKDKKNKKQQPRKEESEEENGDEEDSDGQQNSDGEEDDNSEDEEDDNSEEDEDSADDDVDAENLLSDEDGSDNDDATENLYIQKRAADEEDDGEKPVAAKKSKKKKAAPIPDKKAGKSKNKGSAKPAKAEANKKKGSAKPTKSQKPANNAKSQQKAKQKKKK